MATRPRDFLSNPAWTCVLARLRREYDLILVDGGPLFNGLSATVLHRSVDAAVLVHHRGVTGERAILRAREVLDGQVHRDASGDDDRRPAGVETGRRHLLPPVPAGLEVDRHEPQPVGDAVAELDQALALPGLGAGLIDLEHP